MSTENTTKDMNTENTTKVTHNIPTTLLYATSTAESNYVTYKVLDLTDALVVFEVVDCKGHDCVLFVTQSNLIAFVEVDKDGKIDPYNSIEVHEEAYMIDEYINNFFDSPCDITDEDSESIKLALIKLGRAI